LNGIEYIYIYIYRIECEYIYMPDKNGIKKRRLGTLGSICLDSVVYD
jgi:hypothetical protein